MQDRRQGLSHSKMNGYDLLTLFLENTETFSDHCIESNLIGFIFGAIETTNFAS